MIYIYKASSDLGVALVDDVTGKFLYGEVCYKDRLINFVNSFPEHSIIVLIEKAWQEDLEELYFYIPHLKDMAEVKVVSKINVKSELAKLAKGKKKRSYTLVYLMTGIILGCLLLIPTSFEYKNSVLVKAQSVEKVTQEIVETMPKTESKEKLYKSIGKLFLEVRVEAVTYSSGEYKVIFSSPDENLTVEKLEGFDTATLTKVSSLESDKGANVHIYELEGSL